jgi:hypothetical protein
MQIAFQEFEGDVDSNDGNLLMEARLGLPLVQPFCGTVMKMLRISVSGALVSDRSASASTAYRVRVEMGMVWQQCAQMREPHAAHMGEPCACIPLSLVAMSPLDGLRSSSSGVVLGHSMDSVARMVAIIDIDPPEVLTGSPAQKKRHLWQKG